jgi:hypothetical protein
LQLHRNFACDFPQNPHFLPLSTRIKQFCTAIPVFTGSMSHSNTNSTREVWDYEMDEVGWLTWHTVTVDAREQAGFPEGYGEEEAEQAQQAQGSKQTQDDNVDCPMNAPPSPTESSCSSLFDDGEEQALSTVQQSFIAEMEDPISEPRTPMAEQETSATKKPADTVILRSTSQNLPLKMSDFIITDDDLEETARQLEQMMRDNCPYVERHEVDAAEAAALYQSGFGPALGFKTPTHHAEAPDHVKEKAHQAEQSQISQLTRQVEDAHATSQLYPEVKTHKATKSLQQVEQSTHQVQPIPQTQRLQLLEQPIHTFAQEVQEVKEPVHQPFPLHQLQPAHQVNQPDYCQPQNSFALQRTAEFAGSFNPVVEHPSAAMFVERQRVQGTLGPQEAVADLQYGSELAMTQFMGHKSDNHSVFVPEGQYEEGLAGVIGLTLPQVKSGVRNKKAPARVRNTMIQKLKVFLPYI